MSEPDRTAEAEWRPAVSLGDEVGVHRDFVRDHVHQWRRRFDALLERLEVGLVGVGAQVDRAVDRFVAGTDVLGDAEEPAEVDVALHLEPERVQFDTHRGRVRRVPHTQAGAERPEERLDGVGSRSLAENAFGLVALERERLRVNRLALLIELVDRRLGLESVLPLCRRPEGEHAVVGILTDRFDRVFESRYVDTVDYRWFCGCHWGPRVVGTPRTRIVEVATFGPGTGRTLAREGRGSYPVITGRRFDGRDGVRRRLRSATPGT